MKFRTAIATATTAAVLATSGVALAGATTGSSSSPSLNTPIAATAPAKDTNPLLRHRARVHLRRLLRGAAGVVTKAIGIDRPTLRQELRNGKTIADIAGDHNVDPQTVADALVAAAMKRLDAAVTAGRITSERASKIEQRLPDRITKLVNTWHPKRCRPDTAA
jgi:hypothetical protein